MWTWAVGGGDFVLPPDVGFRIGGSLIATSHVVLEVHYDNPRSLAGQVRTRAPSCTSAGVGLRLHRGLQLHRVVHTVLFTRHDLLLACHQVDSFGFELYYVNTLRQHDAGGMTLGDPTLRMQVSNNNLPSFTGLSWPYESGNLQPGRSELVHRQARGT